MAKILIGRETGWLIWFDDKDEIEVRQAYSDRLASQPGEHDVNPDHFVVMDFSESVLVDHGGRLIDFDHGQGFHPPGAIPKS